MTISLLVSLYVFPCHCSMSLLMKILIFDMTFKHYGLHSVPAHFHFSVHVYFTSDDFKFQFQWSHDEECTFIMPTDL